MTWAARIRILAVALAGGLVTGCETGRATLEIEKLNPELESQLKAFFAAKQRQAIKLVEVDKSFYARYEDNPLLIVKGLAPEVWPYFKAGEKGDWQKMSKLYRQMASRSYHFDNPTNRLDERLTSTIWQPINETFRAFEQLSAANPKYLLAYGREITASVPRGSVLFAGTDAGRFLTTFLSKAHPDGDPFFIISQNQLADGLQLEYLRSMYTNKIHTPAADDSQWAFQDYLSDAKRRLDEGTLKPGENVKLVDGRVQVWGTTAIMEICARLAKIIFDKNSEREFFLDEEYPLDWTYEYAVPHGFILKLERHPVSVLPPDAVRKDREFWDLWVAKCLGEWLKETTSVGEICDFAEKVYLSKDLDGFTGDAQFVQTGGTWKALPDFLGARAVFSKARAALARQYWLRAKHARTPGERDNMLKEADLAFRQAFAFCPYQSVAIGNYINFLFEHERYSDVILVVRAARKVSPANEPFHHWADDVIRAAEKAAATNKESASPTADSP